MIDLVIGYARGYDGKQIHPFISSLRASGYAGRVVLIANGGAAAHAARPRWGIDVRPCPPTGAGMKPHSARFVEILRIAREEPWSGLFIADTRDVIFQRNIAEVLPGDGLHAYEEDDGMTLGTCPYNSDWIRLGYGEAMLDRMREFPISCVGTVCGGRDAMLHYLARLADEVLRLQPKTPKPQDQAAHNHIIRQELPTDIHGNEDQDHVYTVGYIKRGTVQIVDGQIVNAAGEVPAVVHQWDRHKNLVAHVEGL